MAVTLDEAQLLRDAYKAALLAIASGKSYTIGDRTLTRADERFVKQTFAEYDQLVTNLQSGRAGGVGVRRVIPRDL